MEPKRAKVGEDEEAGGEPVVLFVEREIWAKAESKREFPSTLGFAEKLVELGLCPSASEGKRTIKEVLMDSTFSASRVIRSLNLTGSALDQYQQLEQVLGFQSVLFTSEAGATFKELGLGAVLPLTSVKGGPGLESCKTFNFDPSKLSLLTYANVKRGLELLRSDNMIASKKMERMLQQTCPLTYSVFTSKNVFHLRRAMGDLSELAKLALAMEFDPSRVLVLPTSCSSRVFLLKHAKHRLLPEGGVDGETKLAYVPFTNLHSALAALQLGYPLPELNHHLVVRGSLPSNTLVWIAFKVVLGELHCHELPAATVATDNIPGQSDWEDELKRFTKCDFLLPNVRLKVTESRAVTPVGIGFMVEQQ
ncbi:hypothetical protein BASA81_005903 [Batrachochytrium salamandrivorans]|nr:hypothetical protein BASA81_005903 [Batrachochytrium salamandrivorans]